VANTNLPFGLMPLWSGDGTVTNFSFNPRKILKTDTTAIFRGDPVVTGTSTEAGYIRQMAAGSSAQAAGVFWDCEYYSIAGKIPVMSKFWPGTSDALANPFPANIFTNPNARFLAQTGASSGTVSPATIANVGNTVDINYTGASNVGNTTTGQSSCYIDLFTAVASAGTTLPFRIVGLASDFLEVGSPGVDDTTAYNWVVVMFNFAETRTVTAVA
jgi:hypothetical protein